MTLLIDNSTMGSQSAEPPRRKSNSSILNKKYPSLQVSHYPVLLFANPQEEDRQSSVIWKARENEASAVPDCPFLSPTSEIPPNHAAPCSPSRLHPKLSFSCIVSKTMKAQNGGSGRCLSSASPMSASQRHQLWGSAIHHSFENRPSASTESLYNSCNDLDFRYRQQRKRRAGISGGSAAVQRGLPFASGGGSGCSSAGLNMGGRHPALGGRSPQSSFDSNTDVAQISMNWMRMNGLGQGVRPLMTANATQQPKLQASQSTSHLARVQSLRKLHGRTSLEDNKTTATLTRSGTQCDVAILDGEVASRKSVSIAYSNDVEAQKMCDDSETPLMEGKEDNGGGRLIKREQLHEKRRKVCDRALMFSIIGIVLMVIENELRSAHVISTGSYGSISLLCLILLSTVVLVVFVAYFHIIEVQLFMNANAADDWRVAVTTRRAFQIGGELFVCALCPLPLELGSWGRDRNNFKSLHTTNVFLSIAMFVRLYWLCRVMLLHSRLFTDASSRSIAGLNRVNFNARFILKTLMTLCPGTMLIIFTASLWVMAGWILRLCEREYVDLNRRKDMGYVDSIWMIAITFLSVGYGDIVPHTYCGRTMAVITGILGTCASSMVVAVIARKLELTRAEKHVHNFMMDTQLTKQLKHSAANVLRETWLIYKYRKRVEKVDNAKIRMHQRKFLVAIYELRKVKRDQRKLAENLVSLGDVAKTSSNTYELVHDVHSTQEGLSLRITAIEHQLGDMARELGNVAEMLRGRKKSITSDEISPSHRPRRRNHTDT